MLIKTKLLEKNVEDYKQFCDSQRYEKLLQSAEKFKDKKILHINATPQGGGVAEILKTFVPLQRSLGLDSSWYYIKPDMKLFEITKKLHNSLQGSEVGLTKAEKDYYLNYNKKLAKAIDDFGADILMIHDPQPLASIEFIDNPPPAVGRIHIDSSEPNQDSMDFINPFLSQYTKIVFSLEDFVSDKLPRKKIIISPPAIDPLSPKNIDIPRDLCRTILVALGISPDRPLITQVSRYDPWKDPLGVIDAYYIAKKDIPNLQLAMAGVIEAADDPEALVMLQKVQEKAKGDPDIYLITERNIGEENKYLENALQRSSDIVLQKSIREGFGLTVTEAMWKGAPVIGGNVGGIKLQIKDGENGFLVNTPGEAAERIIKLFEEPELAKKIGKAAHESVRQNFLITRLLEDEFEIMEEAL
ncbi:MAG: glycosyltransferase [Candidatus Spechtbacterales bacterium]|nr:glycosyltransferase [Candidatus Spechtbacterales bacterium]